MIGVRAIAGVKILQIFQLQHFSEYELALDVKPGHCKMPVLKMLVPILEFAGRLLENAGT